MPSLKGHERSDEVASDARSEGLTNAAMTLIPTVGVLAIAMRNPAFVKRTNWQSRTAMAIMPPLFVFGLTAEQRLIHRVHVDHEDRVHSKATVDWAEQQMAQQKSQRSDLHGNETLHLSTLYQQSVSDSGVRIVPGDTLSFHHRAMNYAADNPIKVLAGAAIPAVAGILYGNNSKQHLEFSVALLHTRVFGQFTTLGLLIATMGFSEYMNKNGRFITQAEADSRVAEMHRVRAELMKRLHHEREIQEAQQAELKLAHDEDVRDAAMKA